MEESIVSNLTELVGDIIMAAHGSMQVFNTCGNKTLVHQGLLEKKNLAMSLDEQVLLTLGDNGYWINELHTIIKYDYLDVDGKTSYHITDGDNLLVQIHLTNS